MNTNSAAYPPFPDHLSDSSDVDVGKKLLAWWIGFNMEGAGLAPNSILQRRDLAERIVSNTPAIDSNSAEHAAFVRALELAATGEFGRAGAVFREYMNKTAIFAAALDEAVSGRRYRKEIAKLPRQNRLNAWITKELSANPTADAKSILKNLEISGQIDSDGTWRDSKGVPHTTLFPQFEQRVKRCRKKIRID